MVYLTTAGKLWVNIGLIVLSILIGGLVFWLPYLKKRKSVSLRLFLRKIGFSFIPRWLWSSALFRVRPFWIYCREGLIRMRRVRGTTRMPFLNTALTATGFVIPSIWLPGVAAKTLSIPTSVCRFCWRWASTRSLCGCLWPLLAAYLSFSCIASCFAVLARARLFWACSFSSLIPGI